jgi:integrase
MFRKKGSPYWWIAYRDRDGRKVEHSTQTTDRSKAALVESEKRAALWHEKQRGIVPLVDPLFDDVLADYLEAAQRSRDISRELSMARALAVSFAGMTVRSITRASMAAYIKARREAGLADSSISRELKILRAAVAAWKRDHDADDLPALPHDRLAHPPGRVRWLTQEQADALIAAAHQTKAPHLADFIRLALHTGMRSGEMLGLEWSRVDLRQNLIYLETQKNGKRGSVPLNGTGRQALLNRARFRAEHCPAAAHVFCNKQGKPIMRLRTGFAEACALAGITDFRIHDLRHTCAAWLVQAGVPLLDVSNLLRHASIVMTQRYAHLAPSSARYAVARLDSPVGDNLATMPDYVVGKTAG